MAEMARPGTVQGNARNRAGFPQQLVTGQAYTGGSVHSPVRLPFIEAGAGRGQETSEALPTHLWLLSIGPPLAESLSIIPKSSW